MIQNDEEGVATSSSAATAEVNHCSEKLVLRLNIRSLNRYFLIAKFFTLQWLKIKPCIPLETGMKYLTVFEMSMFQLLSEGVSSKRLRADSPRDRL